MKHEHENARRHAYNTIAEATRHLDSGKIRKPKHHQMLTNMIKDATATLDNLDRMEDARPYSDTNIGYNADVRRRYAHDDTRTAIRNAMDVVDRILPRLDDYDYDDDADDLEARRGRPRRTRRGVGRYTEVRRHVRRMPGAEMDDMDDMDNMEMVRRSRRTGRFIKGDIDDDMDDIRRTVDDARRMADDARRAADEARRMRDESRGTSNIYPHTPVMDDRRYEARRDDADNYSNRTDDATTRPGPRR